MKKFQIKDANTEILDVSTETRKVKAVWSRLNNIDLDNDIIVAEAFTKTIKERGPQGKNLVWSLIDHCADMKHAIGKPSELYIQGDMLIAVTPIVETDAGEDVLKLYDAGCVNQHSIGFSTIKSDVGQDGVRVIKELKLYEGSAVLWGANPETPTLAVKSETKETLSLRLENLIKAFKNGNFTNETFTLMEIQIEKIKADLLEIEITQSATAIEPKSNTNDEQVLKSIQQFNNLFKK